MRAIIQRVTEASVKVQGEYVSRINKGLVVLVGFTHEDEVADMEYIANKIVNLRLFSNHDHPTAIPETPLKLWSCSVKDLQFEILSVSQFTLFAKTHKGKKPDFHLAMPSNESQHMYAQFLSILRHAYDGENGDSNHVKNGVFGAMMQVQLINDGPVTIVIDSKDRK